MYTNMNGLAAVHASMASVYARVTDSPLVGWFWGTPIPPMHGKASIT